MKQHITAKQLSELNKIDREKLVDWWTPKEGDFVSYKGKNYFLDSGSMFTYQNFNKIGWGIHEKKPKNYKENRLPLLSIGQMIEFLYRKKQPGKFNSLIISGSKGKGWFVDGKNASDCCDALWEAVKEVLKND